MIIKKTMTNNSMYIISCGIVIICHQTVYCGFILTNRFDIIITSSDWFFIIQVTRINALLIILELHVINIYVSLAIVIP